MVSVCAARTAIPSSRPRWTPAESVRVGSLAPGYEDVAVWPGVEEEGAGGGGSRGLSGRVHEAPQQDVQVGLGGEGGGAHLQRPEQPVRVLESLQELPAAPAKGGLVRGARDRMLDEIDPDLVLLQIGENAVADPFERRGHVPLAGQDDHLGLGGRHPQLFHHL